MDRYRLSTGLGDRDYGGGDICIIFVRARGCQLGQTKKQCDAMRT